MAGGPRVMPGQLRVGVLISGRGSNMVALAEACADLEPTGVAPTQCGLTGRCQCFEMRTCGLAHDPPAVTGSLLR